jgi:hypothetical protein
MIHAGFSLQVRAAMRLLSFRRPVSTASPRQGTLRAPVI